MSKTIEGGQYDGRTIEDIMELDPAWLLWNDGNGYNLTAEERYHTQVNLDEVLPWLDEDD